MIINIKQPEIDKKDLPVNKSYIPKKLVFNLSFLTPDKKYSPLENQIPKNIKLKLLEKIIHLSTDDCVSVLGWDKEKGLEKIPEAQVSLRQHSDFKKGDRSKFCDEYYWVFRLSNKARVIGKMINTTFYIMSVDTKFDQYKH